MRMLILALLVLPLLTAPVHSATIVRQVSFDLALDGGFEWTPDGSYYYLGQVDVDPPLYAALNDVIELRVVFANDQLLRVEEAVTPEGIREETATWSVAGAPLFINSPVQVETGFGGVTGSLFVNPVAHGQISACQPICQVLESPDLTNTYFSFEQLTMRITANPGIVDGLTIAWFLIRGDCIEIDWQPGAHPPQVLPTGVVPVEYSNDLDEQAITTGGHGLLDPGQTLYTVPPDSLSPTDSRPTDGNDFVPGIERGDDPASQVDALAYGNEALLAELLANDARLVFSVHQDAGSNEVALLSENPAGVPEVFYSHEDFYAGDPVDGLEDVDAVELWGEPDSLDACYYSLQTDILSGTSIFREMEGITVSFLSFASVRDAVVSLGYLGEPDLIDVDAMMVKNGGLPTRFDAGDAVLFSIRRVVDSNFDGGEIIYWPAGGSPSFFSHGGHTWDTAFDVVAAVTSALGGVDPGPEAEDVDALEAAPLYSLTGITPSISPGQRVVLHHSVPNPFNPSTEIRFEVPIPAHVSLRIYDVTGRLVAVLVDGELPAGTHSAHWDGFDKNGVPAASGVYYARVEALGSTDAIKLILLK
jgi:hypothetical protein